ncbi:MAG: hypothetical protein K2N90_08310 [Lachnospiraceae bacterium]|nr:hypothetical protein [Lachnospiraceae bacterium]
MRRKKCVTDTRRKIKIGIMACVYQEEDEPETYHSESVARISCQVQ